MKKSSKYKLSTLLALGAVLLGYNQCVTPMTSGKSNSLKFTDQKSSSSTVGTVSRVVSLEAFRTTVYSVTRARCITCHGASQTPMHAASDVNVAYDAVINSSKVDFAKSFRNPIVSEIKPLMEFYRAEGYHQDYIHHNPSSPYVRGVSIPRFELFKRTYNGKLKGKS